MVIGYTVFNAILAALVLGGLSLLVVGTYRGLATGTGARRARRATSPQASAHRPGYAVRGRPRPEA
ncbi:MAG: hypothetical protein ACREPI_02205 [Candidatus Dormibacterales bacterium]